MYMYYIYIYTYTYTYICIYIYIYILLLYLFRRRAPTPCRYSPLPRSLALGPMLECILHLTFFARFEGRGDREWLLCPQEVLAKWLGQPVAQHGLLHL